MHDNFKAKIDYIREKGKQEEEEEEEEEEEGAYESFVDQV